jgi:hypothetical protein
VLDILHPQSDGCEGCSDPVKNAQLEASIKDLSQQLSQVRPPASLPVHPTGLVGPSRQVLRRCASAAASVLISSAGLDFVL